MSLLATIKSPKDLRALPVERLPEVAAEIRQAIINRVSLVGGHLAPNLGVVELTIALHYIFDFAHDRLLFDVGHQCYPHKLLTGRLPLLDNLRTRRGMAGFPEPAESEYDLFRVGHAGTGISTAVGMARGDSLNNESYDPQSRPEGRRVVTLIGDASIANGVAMEGLNNAGTLKRQFLVVLNDNGMSISRPQGALAQYFDRVRLSHLYTGLKKSARGILRHVPGGGLITEAYHKAGEMTKAAVKEPTGESWFEHFGLLTVGPIDGHDLPTLIEFLAEARDTGRPMVLHVKTVKGKGYEVAERDAVKFHSPPSFKVIDPDSCRVEVKSEGRSFTAAFGDAMLDLMERDPKVVTCTAAMPDGTGLTKVLAQFPDRAWDTGICESHALDMMAGLAKTGWKPFFAVYSTFLQRAFDQAFQESSLQGLPVRLCLDRAGLVGGDGAVHHGFCDIALLRTLPGACLMAALDEPSLKASLEFMRHYDDGLSAVRYPRDAVSEMLTSKDCPPFVLGKARLLRPSGIAFPGDAGALRADGSGRSEIRSESSPGKAMPHAAILAYGTPAIDALAVAESLSSEYRIAVYDARFAKPVDTALLHALLEHRIPIITIEDHSLIGGFGAAILEAAQEMGLDASGITRLALPDAFILQDSRTRQLAEAGIDAPTIARAVRAAIAANSDRENVCNSGEFPRPTGARPSPAASPAGERPL